MLPHLTHWGVYGETDPAALVGRIGTPHVIDARGTLDGDRWTRAGWAFTGPGRGALSNHGRAGLAGAVLSTASWCPYGFR